MAKPEKILAQELLEREVLDVTAGEIIGTVVDFGLTSEGKVTHLGILPLKWYDGGVSLPPEAIISVHDERICITDSSTIGEFAPDNETQFSAIFGDAIQGKMVLQEDGELLGELADFSFNLTTGLICDLILVNDEEKRNRIPVEAFKIIGRHYIVVSRGTPAADPTRDHPETPGKAEAALGAAVPEPKVEDQKPDAVKVDEPDTGIKEKPADKPEPKEKAEAPQEEEKPSDTEPQPEEAATEAQPDVPPELEEDAPPPPPPANGDDKQEKPKAGEPTRSEEKAALFNEDQTAPKLSKFDEKKREFLAGRKAHRDIKDKEGNLIAKKDDPLNDDRLNKIINAGILGDVFIEMTLNKKK